MMRMRVSALSIFVMLFMTYGTDCSAANVKQMASQYQQQVNSDSENSERSSSNENYKKRKKSARISDGSTEELISKFEGRKRQRKMGLPQETEQPVFQTEISENVGPTDAAECEVCKAHSTMPNGSEPTIPGEDQNSFENTTINEPTNDATECQTCREQRLTDSALDSMEQFKQNEQNTSKTTKKKTKQFNNKKQKHQKKFGSKGRNFSEYEKNLSNQDEFNVKWKSANRNNNYISKKGKGKRVPRENNF